MRGSKRNAASAAGRRPGGPDKIIVPMGKQALFKSLTPSAATVHSRLVYHIEIQNIICELDLFGGDFISGIHLASFNLVDGL